MACMGAQAQSPDATLSPLEKINGVKALRRTETVKSTSVLYLAMLLSLMNLLASLGDRREDALMKLSSRGKPCAVASNSRYWGSSSSWRRGSTHSGCRQRSYKA